MRVSCVRVYRTPTSVGARRRDFIPGDFSPAPGREEAAEEAVVLFSLLHDALLDMHAYTCRGTDNGRSGEGNDGNHAYGKHSLLGFARRSNFSGFSYD